MVVTVRYCNTDRTSGQSLHAITPTLQIGNAFEARDIKTVLSLGINAIVDLAIDEPPIVPTRDVTYCRIPLIDGEGNSPATLRLAVNITYQLLADQTPTLVACSAGMSRSPVIAAAALAENNKTTLAIEIAKIASIVPHDISPALLADIRHVLENKPQ